MLAHSTMSGTPIRWQTMEPRRERAVSPKRAKHLPCSDEDVLRQLLCSGRVRADPKAERIHATDVLAVDSLERTAIAALCSPDGRCEIGGSLRQKFQSYLRWCRISVHCRGTFPKVRFRPAVNGLSGN